MGWWQWLLISVGLLLAAYGAFLGWLVVRGRRDDARALFTLISDCIILVSRLARDPRVTRRRKLLLLALVGYLALPFDLVVAPRRNQSCPLVDLGAPDGKSAGRFRHNFRRLSMQMD